MQTSKQSQINPQTSIKEIREDISDHSKILTSSLAIGDIPEDWRVTNVVPLLKGSSDKPGDYRPVRLASWQGNYWRTL